jgi:GDPmannose 4,6-dehydratase
MKNKGQLRAILTGVAGQDGSYLAEYLLKKDYDVYGVTRRKSVNQGTENIEHLLLDDRFHLLEGDICDATFISRILHDVEPHEYYNLAAQSHVGYSFKDPLNTFRVTGEAVMMQLEMIRQFSPSTRFYQASTSELYGGLNCPEFGYDESTPFHPRSPYAVAKAAAYYAVVNYREAYGLHASNGILFNHSSPRRGLDFATRKITSGIAKIALGQKKVLRMGNLEAFRDEGHAKDYVRAMYLMMQQDNPDDYVIASGRNASIKEMFEHVCDLAGREFEDTYKVDQRFMRPSDVNFLLGDATKAHEVLGWEPEYDWEALLTEMYENDLAILS